MQCGIVLHQLMATMLVLHCGTMAHVLTIWAEQ
jgi:hypothetical protein